MWWMYDELLTESRSGADGAVSIAQTGSQQRRALEECPARSYQAYVYLSLLTCDCRVEKTTTTAMFRTVFTVKLSKYPGFHKPKYFLVQICQFC